MLRHWEYVLVLPPLRRPHFLPQPGRLLLRGGGCPRRRAKGVGVRQLDHLIELEAVAHQFVPFDTYLPVYPLQLTSLFFVLTGSALHNNVYVFTQLCTVRL